MIIGIGNDICDIRRIERVMNRFGERFLERVFTPLERSKADRRFGSARLGTYAKRWAAKEACSKALGTGFSQGVFHKDMGVVNLPSGKPTLELTGGAYLQLQKLIQAHEIKSYTIHLTLTDEPPYALAQVIIEAVKV